MNQVEAREQYLNFNIKLTEQLFNIKFEGTSVAEKEAFVKLYKKQRDAATDRILSEMYDVKVMINRALGIFPKSFINSSNEIILEPRNNVYFRLEDCYTALDFKCKMFAWVSRPIAKGLNKYWWPKVLKSFNEFMETTFTKDEMHLIYDRLGNDVNRELTVKFIDSGYDLKLLQRT